MIIDFWENVHLFNDVRTLKEKAREYYTEDFITDYAKWKKNLSTFNSLVYDDMLDNDMDPSVWEDMSYDTFCQSVNNGIESCIEANGTIEPTDVTNVLNDMRINHLYAMLEASNHKRFTLGSIIKSMKTVKFL
jgi:hypothetical protein